MTSDLRQAGAVRAACSVAGRYGIKAPGARVLMDCNNTVVHLAPLPLVAKVCAATARPAGPAALAAEMDIALHLGRSGAPIALPSTELPARVHRDGDHALTFWRYEHHDPQGQVDGWSAGRALKECHRALDTYRGRRPSFLDRQVARTGRLLADPRALPELLVRDRAFLDDQFRRLTAELHGCGLTWRLLHGDPHRGNLLVDRHRCLMIDFESVCMGPLEWDLSALPGGGAGLFPDMDRRYLALLRQLRTLCVAVWCSMQSGRVPELSRAAALHLGLLRRWTAPRRAAPPTPTGRSSTPETSRDTFTTSRAWTRRQTSRRPNTPLPTTQRSALSTARGSGPARGAVCQRVTTLVQGESQAIANLTVIALPDSRWHLR